ncbi:cupin domain-containing protein [Fastidiosipila sanguinis]|uniref:Cupin domain-containing protein n=1 Tax=Fastidiosipila sanguinis TaxID=236753 RepID=A0A2S0KL80_9FIRM|nr:cupin domain-containing protein [Fastidiosipila sanguinis]AVM41739.1 cupin domain-containing protein [Fastidiosipila sanguinis]
MDKRYTDRGKQGLVENMEAWTLDNDKYRVAVWTGKYFQMTVQAIQPGDDIDLEVHEESDQFLRIEQGTGVCRMGDAEDNLTFEEKIEPESAILVPAGTWHQVVNTGDEVMKLYTIYAKPDHVEGTVHDTHEDAKNDPNEH